MPVCLGALSKTRAFSLFVLIDSLLHKTSALIVEQAERWVRAHSVSKKIVSTSW